jgi:hypothetical protein
MTTLFFRRYQAGLKELKADLDYITFNPISHHKAVPSYNHPQTSTNTIFRRKKFYLYGSKNIGI